MTINRRVLSASMIGTALEFYDFTLYGFLATLIGPLFFPSDNTLTSLIATFGVFAAGFLARPIGGIFFGYLGDKYGRKKALSWAVLLMALPTLGIGLLPTYQSIGIWAPVLLACLRMMQGFCTGGEYNGAAIFLLEHTPPNRRGLMGGIITSACMIGMILGSLASLWVALTPENLDLWRVPFILGVIPGFVGYYIRRNLAESPEFSTYLKIKASEDKQTPILRSAMSIGCVAGLSGALSYTQYIFLNSLLRELAFINHTDILWLSTIAMFIYGIMLWIMGWIADKIGYERLMKIAAITIFILSYFIFMLIGRKDYGCLWLAEGLLILMNAAFVAPSHAYMLQLFQAHQRYRGIAISFGIGMSLLGGTTPMIATYLYRSWGISGPAYYLMGCALLSYVCIVWCRQAFNARLIQPRQPS